MAGMWSTILFVVCSLHQLCLCQDSSYDNVNQLMQDLVLNNSGYNKYLRPVNNQSETITLNLAATLLGIVEVDDVEQVLTFNTFFYFMWIDQRLSWDSSKFGQVSQLAFDTNHIWKPQFVMHLSQTGQVFTDDKSHLFVSNNGLVVYGPGGVYKAICQVDMRKFPFDTQTCAFSLCPIGYTDESVRIQILTEDYVNQKTLENEEWEIKESGITPIGYPIGPNAVSCAHVSLTLKRRPAFMLVNIVLPVVFISFINILSFIIPQDSGEKISYAVTLLLSLSVYMTVVSDQVPRSSNKVPALTIYLFIVLINSLLSVVVTVILVYLHHHKPTQGEPDDGEDSQAIGESILQKLNILPSNNKVKDNSDDLAPTTIFNFFEERENFSSGEAVVEHSPDITSSPHKGDTQHTVMRQTTSVLARVLIRNGNLFAFIVFTLTWTASTVWYFRYAMT